MFLLQPVFAEPKIISTVDATEIFMEEELTLSVAITDPNLKDLNFPSRTIDYEVVATSSSTSFQIINGVSSQNKTVNFVLRALHPGKIVLPPVMMTDGTNQYSTEPITITVLAARMPAARAPGVFGGNSAPPLASPGNPAGANSLVNNNQVFARLEVDNLSPYENQQVYARLKIYHRGNLRSLNVPPLKLDKFNQKKDPSHKEYNETYKGLEYLVYELDYAIFPIQSGLLTIPKLDFLGIVVEEQPFNPRQFDPFRMLSPFFVEKEITITAPSVTLNVRELPPGAPLGFSGYVGQLDLVDVLKPNALKTGEAATLSMRISGNGNFRNLNFDRLQSLKIFNVYKDKQSVGEKFSANALNFSGTVNYALIPTKAKGDLKITLKPIVIFNPRTGRYEERGNSEFDLKVTYDPSVKVDEIAKPSGDDKEPDTILQFSASQIKKYRSTKLFNEVVWLILIAVLNLVYLITLLVIKIKQSEISPSEEYAREFSESVKTIKTATDIPDISKAVKDLLLGNEQYIIDDAVQTKIQEFVNETDMLNYSIQEGSLTEAKLTELKTKALNLIKLLSKELKRKKG